MSKIKQISKDDLLNYSLGQKINIHEALIKDIDKSVKLDSKKFRLRKISKIIFDKDEDSIHKLTTIFSTINSLGSDLMYILNNKDSKLTFYIGVIDKKSQDLNNSDKTLEQVFNSNFSGCEISKKFLGDSEEIKILRIFFLAIMPLSVWLLLYQVSKMRMSKKRILCKVLKSFY